MRTTKMMRLRVKKLTPKATLPKSMTSNDAGMDLTATKIIKSNLFSVWYATDVAVEIPQDHFGLIAARSSITNDGALTLANSVGIIDSGYRNGIQVRFNRTLKGFFTRKQYEVGDRIAQLIIVPYKKCFIEETEDLSSSDRKGGFGHTGRK